MTEIVNGLIKAVLKFTDMQFELQEIKEILPDNQKVCADYIDNLKPHMQQIEYTLNILLRLAKGNHEATD